MEGSCVTSEKLDRVSVTDIELLTAESRTTGVRQHTQRYQDNRQASR